MVITDQELKTFCDAFQGNEEAMDVLRIVKDCDGNLEDARGIVAPIATDRYVLRDNDWIDFENLKKELRHLICTPAFESAFVQGAFGVGLAYLTTQSKARKVSRFACTMRYRAVSARAVGRWCAAL